MDYGIGSEMLEWEEKTIKSSRAVWNTAKFEPITVCISRTEYVTYYVISYRPDEWSYRWRHHAQDQNSGDVKTSDEAKQICQDDFNSRTSLIPGDK